MGLVAEKKMSKVEEHLWKGERKEVSANTGKGKEKYVYEQK